jgi:hypothetical protein
MCGGGVITMDPSSPLPSISERTFAFTFFHKGATDNHPCTEQLTLQALQAVFQRTWTPKVVKSGEDPKKATAGGSFATFNPGKRDGQNVVSLHGVLIDFDNAKEVPTGEFHLGRNGLVSNRPKVVKVCLPNPVHPEDVVRALELARVPAMVYTTWSHKAEWPRFRVAVPFAKQVAADHWEPSTEYVLGALGLDGFRRGIDFPALRDKARMYFLPDAADPSSIRRWQLDGNLLLVPTDELQQIQVPDLPRLPWQEEIIRTRASTDSTWFHRYQAKGRPVDFRSLGLVALLRAMGIKVGRPQSYSGGTKWRTHCPWASEHTHGLDDDSAVVIHIPGHWPIWRCAHSHHAHLGLRDLLEAFGGAL